MLKFHFKAKLTILNFLIVAITSSTMYGQGQSLIPSWLNSKVIELKRENRYDEAIAELEAFCEKTDHNRQFKAVFETKLLEADLYRILGQTRKASDLLDSLQELKSGELEEQDPLFGELYTIKGTIFLTRGELEKGRVSILKAIKIYSENYGIEDTLLGPCYNKLGNYYYFRKICDSAMICYSKALDLTEKKIDNSEDRASYIQNLGIIHLEMSNYAAAESCFLQSLSLKETVYSSNNFSLGRLYLNLGRFYEGISVLDKALFYLQKAEKIYSVKGGNSHLELGKIYWNKGLLYHLSGDSESALSYLFNAKQIIDSVFFDNQSLIASLNSDIANVYNFLGQNNRAIYFYNSALSGADNTLRKKIYRNLGKLYNVEGDYITANHYFNLLMKESKNTLQISNPENALTFLQYGFFLLESGNDSAITYLNTALKMFNENKGYHNKEIAATLYMIGDYYSKKDQLMEALNFYQKSLIANSKSFTDTCFKANPGVEMLTPDIKSINALSKKANCLNSCYIKYQDIGFLMSSIEAYEICFDLIDITRLTLKGENSQMYLQDGLDNLYTLAIRNYMTAFEITKDKEWLYHAYIISERGKSVVLLNELKDANAKKIAYIPESITKFEKEIKTNINQYKNNIWEQENLENPDEKKLSYYRTNLLTLEKRDDSLKCFLETNYPSYYKLKYDHSAITVEKLQQILDDDEILIEYTLAENSLYTFLISPEIFKVKMVPFDSSMIKDIFILRKNLDFKHVPEYSFEDFMEYQITSFKLYSKLIAPVIEDLPDNKLIIIPDKELNYLSFESLTQQIVMSDTIAFRDLPYLIKQWPISYAPSATVLAMIKKDRMPYIHSGVLALAPSLSVVTRSMMVKNKALADILKHDMNLPGATWEAETILKVMKGKKLLGEDATESEFKKLASSYDILHFATHTRIDDKNPLSSLLAFYPYGGFNEDGVLHTYEIYNLDLKGELAVLSACSTGNGVLLKGEGVISLARAFTYAGMPSVLMTLWDVEDISTGNIVPSFYQLLEKGIDKDIALQMAKLKYLKRTKPEIETHPAFWSGFVLYGNSKGFRQRADNVYTFFLIVLGCLVILISFVLVRKFTRFNKRFRSIHIDLPTELQHEDRL